MKLYLSSYEYETFEIPIQILHLWKIVIENRNVLVIDMDKPINGQKYGLAGNEIKTMYLINRVNENAFDKLDLFPIDVHVLIPKNIKKLVPITLSDLQNIAWACLYDNEEDAKNHKIK